MTHAEGIICRLNDNQVIAMVNRIHNRIFAAVDFANIEKSAGASDQGEVLLGLDRAQHRQKLDSGTSVALSRRVLHSMAADESLSFIVEDAWEVEKRNDTQFVGTVVAAGIMVNLTLFMISSEIDVDLGKVRIRKRRVDSDAVKAIMEPITKAVGMGASA